MSTIDNTFFWGISPAEVALKAAQVEHLRRPRYGERTLNPDRPLTGRFQDYLTDIDVTSPCERLPEDYQRHLDGWVRHDGKWWRDLDKDRKALQEFEQLIKKLF